MTERLHFIFSLSCIGEGNGNPLQCSCLENPRDEGAWWAAFYGVAQSQTRLKRLSSSSSSNTNLQGGKRENECVNECFTQSGSTSGISSKDVDVLEEEMFLRGGAFPDTSVPIWESRVCRLHTKALISQKSHLSLGCTSQQAGRGTEGNMHGFQ